MRLTTFTCMKVILKYLCILCLATLYACNSSDNEYTNLCTALNQTEHIYQHPNGMRSEYKGSDTLRVPPELANAAIVFAEKKEYEKAAKASLYCGYAQNEYRNKALAIKLFKDAEQYGELSGDSITIARAEYNLARLLFLENDTDAAISMSILADQNFGNNYNERAYVYNLMASIYISIQDYNNAEYYLNKSLEFADITNSLHIKSMTLNNYSVYYREQCKYDEAITCLLQKRNIDTDSTKMVMFNLNMGKVFLYKSDYDSAAYYTKNALELSNHVNIRPETKTSIYFSLYYITKKQGDYKQSLEYYDKYTTLQYQIHEELATKNLFRIQQQYDYEVLQNSLNEKIINRQRIILIISILLLTVSIVVIILLIRQRNILKENKEIKQELDKTKEELQKSVKPEVVEEELSRQLHLIIMANRISKRADDFKREWAPLVIKINNEQENMFDGAVTAIERVYPDMYTTILQKYPNLNDTESKVLMLSCSDLTNAEIGYILNLSVHSVNKSRSEIRKKIVK